MSEFDDDLKRALDGRSDATFDDLRRRLDADRPGACLALEEELTSLGTGGDEPEAEHHAAECARCRDRVDAARDLWRRLTWPASTARFADLRPRLLGPVPFRWIRAAAAAILAGAVAWAILRPHVEPPNPGLAARLERDGFTLDRLAGRGTPTAARALIAIGGPAAEARLLSMMGRDPEVDALAAAALTGEDVGPMHPADLVRDRRPDLLPALIDSAPPGSASTIVPALFDARLGERAARALARLPRHEVDAALEMAALGATTDEARAFASRGISVAGAVAAASRSADFRAHCFWKAMGSDEGFDFLFAAAGTGHLREEALMFLDLKPAADVATACREALDDPELAAGAARAAARLGDRTLIPFLRKAARDPRAGKSIADFEVIQDGFVSGRSVTFRTVCERAADELASNR